jgi:hypothetical protein
LQDDDSDLEYEVEALPTVSNEASTEAAACVKVYLVTFILNDWFALEFFVLHCLGEQF